MSEYICDQLLQEMVHLERHVGFLREALEGEDTKRKITRQNAKLVDELIGEADGHVLEASALATEHRQHMDDEPTSYLPPELEELRVELDGFYREPTFSNGRDKHGRDVIARMADLRRKLVVAGRYAEEVSRANTVSYDSQEMQVAGQMGE